MFTTFLGAFLLFSRSAHAQQADPAAAQTLFDEARRLVEKKDYTAACPKFAESQKLDAAPGTLLHLADCWEKSGKIALAWSTYLDAASAAKAIGKKAWAETGDARAKALEPRLPHFTLTVQEPAPGMEVRRDGTLLGAASYATSLPIDPGEHVFEADATGHEHWTMKVTFAEAQNLVLRVPPLTPIKRPIERAPTPPPVVPEQPRTSVLTPLGYTALAVGAAGIVVGGVFGGLALSNDSRAIELCPKPACSSREGVDASERARTFSTVSTIGLAVGLGFAITGVIMLFAAPSNGSRSASGLVGPRFDGATLRF
jgi:hypothetical protein